MEIFQILQKNIPQKKNIFLLCHTHQPQDISKSLLQMIKKVKKETHDSKMLNLFCIELYDILYYYILFDRIKVTKKFLRLLEHLALPINCVGERQWNDVLKKTCKMKL